MSKQDDGGPAFPLSDPVLSNGMSLRDYFAAQALIGTLVDFGSEVDGRAFTVIARRAFALADAMIAARAKPLKGAA